MASETVLVTGATGLAGSNACRLGLERGYRIRALVRNKGDVEPLEKLGAESASGDITNPESLDQAMRDVTHVIHCAAVLGGTWSTATPEEIMDANMRGAINVLAAAERAGVQRTIMFSSVAICDWSETLTEASRILPIGAEASPYARAKVATYYESMARAARGQFVATVIPGGIYGPSPLVERALVPTSVNCTLLDGATGKLERYLPFVMPWVYAEDAANIALNALEKGKSGARYLAVGRLADAASFPAICNRFSEMVGSAHRVDEFDPTASPPAAGTGQGDDYSNMMRYVVQSRPDPLFDSSVTSRELEITPTSVDEGLARTVSWLRELGKV
jgi:dihydroflavonol-4-reductase